MRCFSMKTKLGKRIAKSYLLVLALFFMVIMVGSQTLPLVNASFLYNTWTMPTHYANDDINCDTLQLNNTKILYAYAEFTDTYTAHIHIRQYSSAGVLDAHYESGNYGTWPSDTLAYNMQGLKMRWYPLSNTTAVLVFTHSYAGGSYTYWYAEVILWNGATGTISGDIDQATLKQIGTGGYNNVVKVSSLFACKYGEDIYFIVMGNIGYQGHAQYISVFYYDTSGDILTVVATTTVGTTTSNTQEPAQLFGFQDTSNLDKVYFATPRVDLSTTAPVYYIADLDTGALEVQYTGSSGYWSQNYYMWFIGGGVHSQSGYYYVYFNYAKPYLQDQSRRYWIIQQVLEYNNTINVANLCDTGNRVIDFNPMLPYSITEVSWIVGYTSSYDSFRVKFPEISGGVWYVMYADITVNSFTDLDAGSFSSGTWLVDSNMPVHADMDKVGWANSYTCEIAIDLSEGVVFYGITPQGTSYDVVLTWSPNNNPLLTNIKYTFTDTATLSGYAWNGKTIAVYINGLQVAWKIPSAGKITFDKTFTSAGYYNVTTKLYDQITGLVYTESENILVNPGTTPPIGGTPGLIMPGFFEVFTALFPAFLVVGIPSFALGEAGAKAGIGQMGFIFGAIIGIGLGFMTGLIPPAVFYLIILFVGVMLVMVVRSKFGSSGD